jgi:hypothetical protein
MRVAIATLGGRSRSTDWPTRRGGAHDRAIYAHLSTNKRRQEITWLLEGEA